MWEIENDVDKTVEKKGEKKKKRKKQQTSVWDAAEEGVKKKNER